MRCGECGCNMIVMQSWKKKKDGTKTRWRYLKCSAYRRAGKNGCVNHVPLLYEDFRAFILKQLKKKGNQIELNFENTLARKRETQIEIIEKNINVLKEKNTGLVDLYLEKLINKAE